MRALSLILAMSTLVLGSHAGPARAGSPDAPSGAEALVSRYCGAWSKTDPAERAVAVSNVWSERGEYVDSQPVRVAGRDALVAEIVKFQKQFPGASFRCSAVRTHHDFVGYTWTMVMADGSERFRGMDFGQLDDEGRLLRIVSFFDMPAAAP